MIKVGIVGHHQSNFYIDLIQSSKFFELVGVFDPGFQFEPPDQLQAKYVFTSFHELVIASKAMIFASAEKIFLPLMEQALRYARPVFLSGVYSLSLEEQYELIILQNEANEHVQVSQPILFHDAFINLQKFAENPLILNWTFADSTEYNLFLKTRLLVSAGLHLFKSNIRKTTVNVFSACAQLPDVIKIRIDFDNGSILEIQSNCIDTQNTNQFICIDYNKHLTVDFIANSITGQHGSQPALKYFNDEHNTPDKLLDRQLNEFYYCITKHKSPANSLENEFQTQQVVEKVKEKLRLSINIF